MKLLWVSPRWPLPANDGARQATLSLLRELVPATGGNLQLDLACFCDFPDPNEEAVRKEIAARRLLILPKEKKPASAVAYAWSRLGSQLPYTSLPYGGTEARRRLREWAEGECWDAVVVDGLHGFPVLRGLTLPPTTKIYYRAHNVEWELWRQSRESSAWNLRLLALAWETRLNFRLERELCRRSESVFAVSPRDANLFRSVYGIKNALSLPIGLSLPSSPSPVVDSSLRLLFVGRLDWSPNREGLEWFLENVWPALPSTTELRVVGSGDGNWLKSRPRVEIFRDVPCLAPHYAWSSLSLIPLFTGSGTRVKAIESAGHGRSFLSTTKGAEGLPFSPGGSYLQSDNCAEWINLLCALTPNDCRTLGAQAEKIARENFHPRSIALTLVREARLEG